MKKIIPFLLFIPFLGSQAIFAQDYDDSETASHTLTVTVPEIALLDIYDPSTGVEAVNVDLNMANIDVDPSGDGSGTAGYEAGLYDYDQVTNSDLFLNYTSVVPSGESRTISVNLTAASELPPSFVLRVVGAAPTLENTGNGTPGTVVAGGVTLDATETTPTVQPLVTGIGSVYTGDGSFGVQLTYSLEKTGNFEDYLADTYISTVVYTLGDSL